LGFADPNRLDEALEGWAAKVVDSSSIRHGATVFVLSLPLPVMRPLEAKRGCLIDFRFARTELVLLGVLDPTGVTDGRGSFSFEDFLTGVEVTGDSPTGSTGSSDSEGSLTTLGISVAC
jgi:hypothetical protein